ncbi:hypothetical protein HDV04_002461 [Boothiomyces sp. JEL0838]|nr:hypothetical protein HDV04_002461 [Boothiomyces sp. JEL0838]
MSCWYQRLITLNAKPRGFHLVTDEILSQLKEISEVKMGMCNIFIQHTSASLAVNESYDSSVRVDMENIMNKIAPESDSYVHNDEGPDDMPAHIKTALIGVSLNIPISNGRLALGTWQGIWLCEHRDHGGRRKIMVTINGQSK